MYIHVVSSSACIGNFGVECMLLKVHYSFLSSHSHPFTCTHTHAHTEACKLQPSVIEVVQKNKAMMVRKVARRHSEAPLQG